MKYMLMFLLFSASSHSAVELYRVSQTLKNPKTIQLDVSAERGCGLIPKARIRSVALTETAQGGHVYIIADDRVSMRARTVKECARSKDSLFLDVSILQSETPEDRQRLVLRPGYYRVWMNGDLKGHLKILNPRGDFRFKPFEGHHEPTAGMVTYRRRKNS